MKTAALWPGKMDLLHEGEYVAWDQGTLFEKMMEAVIWVVRRFIKHLRARFRMLHLDSKGRAMGVAEHHTRPKSLLLPAYRGSARALQTAAARYAATLAAW